MISFVICSIDPPSLALMRENLSRIAGERAHEIVAIPDARSLAEGYNRGIDQCRGEAIVFCHDDIEILSPDLFDRLDEHLRRFDVIGVAGTDKLESGRWSRAGHPHVFGQVAHVVPEDGSFLVESYGLPSRIVQNIEALDGLFIATTREVARSLRFDADTFTGFHQYDVDFTFRACLAGHRLAVCNDIHLIHHSRGKDTNGRYEADVEAFDRKHAAHLRFGPARWFRTTAVHVRTRDEVVEVMRSPARFWVNSHRDDLDRDLQHHAVPA